MVACKEKRSLSIQVRYPSVDAYLVLDLNLAEVVDFPDSFLYGGWMTHADQPWLDVDDLQFCVKQLKNFL